MKVTARQVIAQRKVATSFVFELLRALRAALPPAYEWVDSNYTATGAEALVRDTGQQTKWPMEYVVTVTPKRRPQDVTLQ